MPLSLDNMEQSVLELHTGRVKFCLLRPVMLTLHWLVPSFDSNWNKLEARKRGKVRYVTNCCNRKPDLALFKTYRAITCSLCHFCGVPCRPGMVLFRRSSVFRPEPVSKQMILPCTANTHCFLSLIKPDMDAWLQMARCKIHVVWTTNSWLLESETSTACPPVSWIDSTVCCHLYGRPIFLILLRLLKGYQPVSIAHYQWNFLW